MRIGRAPGRWLRRWRQTASDDELRCPLSGAAALLRSSGSRSLEGLDSGSLLGSWRTKMGLQVVRVFAVPARWQSPLTAHTQ